MGGVKDIKLSEGAAPVGPKKRGRKRLHSPHKSSASEAASGGEDGHVDGRPSMQGRQMMMFLNPGPKKDKQ